jgi:hypothetical protein
MTAMAHGIALFELGSIPKFVNALGIGTLGRLVAACAGSA